MLFPWRKDIQVRYFFLRANTLLSGFSEAGA